MASRAKKDEAQDKLMQGMQAALTSMSEDDTDPDVYEAAIRQFRRVEAFLGYERGSWAAGV